MTTRSPTLTSEGRWMRIGAVWFMSPIIGTVRYRVSSLFFPVVLDLHEMVCPHGDPGTQKRLPRTMLLRPVDDRSDRWERRPVWDGSDFVQASCGDDEPSYVKQLHAVQFILVRRGCVDRVSLAVWLPSPVSWRCQGGSRGGVPLRSTTCL